MNLSEAQVENPRTSKATSLAKRMLNAEKGTMGVGLFKNVAL